MVAVVERGGVLLFCDFFFFLFFWLTIKETFDCKKFIAKVVGWLWWFLIRGYMEWPFVLQISSSPFDFISSLLWVPSLVRSISMTLRQIYFCSVLLGEVDFDDLETRLLTFL